MSGINTNRFAVIAIVIAVISLAVSLGGPSGDVTGAAVSYTTTTPLLNNTSFGEPEWQCGAQDCVRFITGQEWVNQNCRLNETGVFNCVVVINSQPLLVPLDAINISTVSSCAESVCTLEILTRTVNQSV